MFKKISMCALAIIAGAHISFAQQSMSFGASKDNTLYEDATGELSNGAGSDIIAGNTGQGFTRRGIIAFDLSALPAGAVIEKVTLELHLTKGKSQTASVAIHKVNKNWGEGTSNADGAAGQGAQATTGDATWKHAMYNTSDWTNLGGDFEATATASIDMQDEVIKYSWANAQMIADVEGWIATPSSNFGWMIIGDESTAGTTRHFSSKDHATESQRPQLTILYSTTNSVYNVASSDALQLYPNPFNNSLTINLPNYESTMTVRVLNSEMKEVYLTVINSGDTIDLSRLEQGVYFAFIQTSEGIITRKIVKTTK